MSNTEITSEGSLPSTEFEQQASLITVPNDFKWPFKIPLLSLRLRTLNMVLTFL